MQGNQTIQLSSLERALSAAVYYHQLADNCCGALTYLGKDGLNLNGLVNHRLQCRVCKKKIKIAMLIE